MQSATFHTDPETLKLVLAEEDEFSYFINLEDVKCPIANNGRQVDTSDFTFVFAKDLFAEDN